MNAGNSPIGLDFACRQCDWIFVTARTLDEYRKIVQQAHGYASKYGRVIRPSTMVYVIMAETDAHAKEIVDWVEEEVDREVDQ